MKLRPYQRKAVDDIFAHFANSDEDTCALLPTAAGKSVILATFMREACEAYADTRIIVLTHVAKLLKQNMEKLISVWPEAPADFYSASLKRKNHRAQIIFAGIQSVWKQAYKIQRCDIILIDECHLLGPNDDTRYRKFINDIRTINPHVRIVGLTASPWRLDSGVIYGQADSLFKSCCHETTIPELLDGGFLCPIRTLKTSEELDVSGVKIRGGEFVAGELQAAVDKDEVTRACIDEVVKLDARPGLLFATGVQHAYHIRDEVRERGFTCEVIDGDTPEGQRDLWIGNMLAGRLDYLANCGTLTTGVDIPNLRMIGDLAPTKSPALHVQKLGRLMRLSSGKDVGIVLDFARNVDLHGPIDLIKPKPKGAKGSGDAPSKTCPECDEKVWAGLRECACGYEFPPPEVKFTPKASEAAIISTQIEPEWIKVRDVSYAVHRKLGKPDSLRITYQCGLAFHSDWQCFEHTGYARQKAEQWWKRMGGCNPIPADVGQCIVRKGELAKPSAILVRKEGKYTRVVSHRFDDGMKEEAA